MIVLASSSPRRRQLLEMLGIPHDVVPSDIDESPRVGEGPRQVATRLAREKALAVAQRRPGAWVLGADTIVVLNGDMLGKPVSPADAEQMLARLSGVEHQVITAVALVRDGDARDRCDETRVWFRPLGSATIRDYVATGEPLDKAGSYGVQGKGAVLIERIEGDFFGVMGLPLRHVVDLMNEAGLNYRLTR